MNIEGAEASNGNVEIDAWKEEKTLESPGYPPMGAKTILVITCI